MWKKWLIFVFLLPPPTTLRGQGCRSLLESLHRIENWSSTSASETESTLVPGPRNGPLGQNQTLSSSMLGLFAFQTNQDDNEWVRVWGPWIFGGLVLLIGAFQIALLFVVWRAISRQAKIQRSLTHYWVDVGNWSVGGGEPWEVEWDIDRAGRVGVEKSRKLKDSLSIGINFEIFNRTPYPVAIDSIIVFAGVLKEGDWHWKTYEDRSSLLLRPQSNAGENSEAFGISFDLGTDEIIRYVKEGFYTRIYVRIFYFDSDAKTARQDFPVEAVLKPGVPVVFTKPRSRKIKEAPRQSNGAKQWENPKGE
jgi:hypothetical protein